MFFSIFDLLLYICTVLVVYIAGVSRCSSCFIDYNHTSGLLPYTSAIITYVNRWSAWLIMMLASLTCRAWVGGIHGETTISENTAYHFYAFYKNNFSKKVQRLLYQVCCVSCCTGCLCCHGARKLDTVWFALNIPLIHITNIP